MRKSLGLIPEKPTSEGLTPTLNQSFSNPSLYSADLLGPVSGPPTVPPSDRCFRSLSSHLIDEEDEGIVVVFEVAANPIHSLSCVNARIGSLRNIALPCTG